MGEDVPTQRSLLFRALRARIQDWSGWVQEPPLVALVGSFFSPAARRRDSLFLSTQAGALRDEEDRSGY